LHYDYQEYQAISPPFHYFLKNIAVSTRTRKNVLYPTALYESSPFRLKNPILRLLRILLDGQAPAEYNIYQTNITESHKQKIREQNMADTKIKPQHHPAKSFSKSPPSLHFLASSCLGSQDPRSTLVETPLQIGLFLQNKANFKMGNINISTAKTKAYANEQRTMSNERYSKQTQTNPIPSRPTSIQRPSSLVRRPSSVFCPPPRPAAGLQLGT
jgi:hypothetical protein